MFDRLIRFTVFRVAAALVGILLSHTSAADTIRLDQVGTFTTDSYQKNASLGSVRIAGSSPLNVLELNGLSVVGGFSDLDIDSGESISLTFVDSFATALSLTFSRISNPNGIKGTPVAIEAFGINRESYGVKPFIVGASTVSISGAFADLPISKLIFVSGEDGHMLSQIHYDPILVPEPSEWALLCGGLALLLFRARRLNQVEAHSRKL